MVTAAEQLVHYNTNGPNVYTLRDFTTIAKHYFRRHIEKSALFVRKFIFEYVFFTQTKIDNLHWWQIISICEEYILWLQISMHNVFPLQVRYRVDKLSCVYADDVNTQFT